MYYVYKITEIETGRFYIGYSNAKKFKPENHLGVRYFTSGHFKEAYKANKFKFEKQIVCTFAKKRQAFAYEQSLITMHFYEEKCMNKNVRGFPTKTRKWCEHA